MGSIRRVRNFPEESSVNRGQATLRIERQSCRPGGSAYVAQSPGLPPSLKLWRDETARQARVAAEIRIK